MLPDHRNMGRYLKEQIGNPTARDLRTVMAALGLSNKDAARICGPTTAEKRIREMKAGKRRVLPHLFAQIAYTGGPLVIRIGLLHKIGPRWWEHIEIGKHGSIVIRADRRDGNGENRTDAPTAKGEALPATSDV